MNTTSYTAELYRGKNLVEEKEFRTRHEAQDFAEWMLAFKGELTRVVVTTNKL